MRLSRGEADVDGCDSEGPALSDRPRGLLTVSRPLGRTSGQTLFAKALTFVEPSIDQPALLLKMSEMPLVATGWDMPKNAFSVVPDPVSPE